MSLFEKAYIVQTILFLKGFREIPLWISSENLLGIRLLTRQFSILIRRRSAQITGSWKKQTEASFYERPAANSNRKPPVLPLSQHHLPVGSL